MIWTVPGWVDVDVVELVEDEEAVVWLRVDVLAVLLAVVEEVGVVEVKVVVELVVKVDVADPDVDDVRRVVVELVVAAEVDDWDAVLIDVLSPSDEDTDGPICVDA